MARRRRFSDEPFGRAVERLMVDSGVSYREAADRVGVSVGYLNHIVHGNRPIPSDERIEAIATALGVEPDYFLAYRIRRITQRLETMPKLVNNLYKRLSGAASPRGAAEEPITRERLGSNEQGRSTGRGSVRPR